MKSKKTEPIEKWILSPKVILFAIGAILLTFFTPIVIFGLAILGIVYLVDEDKQPELEQEKEELKEKQEKLIKQEKQQISKQLDKEEFERLKQEVLNERTKKKKSSKKVYLN